jgi:hypothetical protein
VRRPSFIANYELIRVVQYHGDGKPYTMYSRSQGCKGPNFCERHGRRRKHFRLGATDVGAFLNGTFGPGVVTPAELASVYPGLSGFPEISRIDRDFGFLW